MNIIRHTNPDVTKCPICYDVLEKEDQYTIPDCLHTFHTNCIVHWFRNGYTHCPLCNHSGLGTTKYVNQSFMHAHSSIKHNKTKFKLIKEHVKKNNGPDWLQKKINVYNTFEDKIKETKKKIKDTSESEGVYNHIRKKIKILEKQLNKLEWDSKKYEKLIMSFPIYPVIIVQYKKPKQLKKPKQPKKPKQSKK
jgi:hypothetical protein